jgi:hypothetical protein
LSITTAAVVVAATTTTLKQHKDKGDQMHFLEGTGTRDTTRISFFSFWFNPRDIANRTKTDSYQAGYFGLVHTFGSKGTNTPIKATFHQIIIHAVSISNHDNVCDA